MRITEEDHKAVAEALKQYSAHERYIDENDIAEILVHLQNDRLSNMPEYQRDILWDALGVLKERSGELNAIYYDLTKLAFPRRRQQGS